MVAVVLGLGCRPAPPGPPKHIVLISLDTLRRDHVGLYSASSSAKTPNLDHFACSSIRFNRAFAQESFTLSSHMSMMTGLYPVVHAVDRNHRQLSRSVSTLAEILHEQGFAGIGLVSSYWVNGEFGFDRGFDHYEVLADGLTFAPRLTERALALLDAAIAEEERVFLFLHYLDAHSDFVTDDPPNKWPYFAPGEDFPDVPADGWEALCVNDQCATEALLEMDRKGIELSESQLRLLKDLYASGITYLDREIGILLAALEGRGLFDDSLIIVTSDHGEEFREHGRLLHSQPFVENLAIPLLIRLPGGSGGGALVDDVVETVDFLPTVLDGMGLEKPPWVQGHSLFRGLNGEMGEPSFSVGRDKHNHERFVIRSADHSLVWDRSTGSTELFFRTQDPGEQVNVIAENPELAHRLLEELKRRLENSRLLKERFDVAAQVSNSNLEPHERERLRELGYLQ